MTDPRPAHQARLDVPKRIQRRRTKGCLARHGEKRTAWQCVKPEDHQGPHECRCGHSWADSPIHGGIHGRGLDMPTALDTDETRG